MHTGQRGPHAGSSDSSCNTHAQTKCGGLQRSCAAQVQKLIFDDMMRRILNLFTLENLEQRSYCNIWIWMYCRLVEEVSQINETVDQLKMKLREAENALQHLLRTKSSLEHDLAIKNNSIFVDREKCMGMRKTFPMSPRVASY